MKGIIGLIGRSKLTYWNVEETVGTEDSDKMFYEIEEKKMSLNIIDCGFEKKDDV